MYEMDCFYLRYSILSRHKTVKKKFLYVQCNMERRQVLVSLAGFR